MINSPTRLELILLTIDVDKETIGSLQGKYPLEEVFADIPIKISQKSTYSG